MKVGLYSITYLGLWYDGPALSLRDLIARAGEHGYKGIEIDGKRPHGNPGDWPDARCRELRERAEDAGIEIYAVAANNDFSSPIPEHREAQLAYVRDLIRMTAALGAPVMRVFVAWPGVTRSGGVGRYDVARRVWHEAHSESLSQETWDRCRDGLIEAARRAGEEGVTLALQNHPPVIENYHDLLRMIWEVDSPRLMACLDAPLLARQGQKDMREAVFATGALQVLSHFGGEYDRPPGGAARSWVRQPDGALVPEDFYAAFVAALRDTGYRGYLGYELCHPLPVLGDRTVGIEFADRNARLAAEYMRGLIAGARA